MSQPSLNLRGYQAELEAQNQALRFSQLAAEGASERFSALFSHIPLALMVVDEGGLILESNAKALLSFRPLESDPPLTYLAPLVTPLFADRVATALATAKLQGRCEVPEVVLLAGVGASLAGDLHIARIDNPQDELAHFICAFVDQGPLLAQRLALQEKTLQLQRRNEEIQQIEAQLRESQKMQAIGTMAGGIAHDFNNILGAILGNVELARQDVDIDSPAQVSLLEIDKAGRRARDLVRQILTFSRKEPPRREPVQLADIVHEVARLIRMELPANIELQVHIDPETVLVLAEATQVQQALMNLCTNALQAIGAERGCVRIELGMMGPEFMPSERHASRQERRAAARPPQVVLAVHDTGAGIDADTVQRVFEPFFTTKPTGQGTGLGLAVVHGVMRAHEGYAHVRSSPSMGSVFTLHFPIAQLGAPETAPSPLEPAANALATPMESARQTGGRATSQSGTPRFHSHLNIDNSPEGQPHIMVVDDDTALIFLVERALKRRNFQVSAFTDPQAALVALRAAPESFDLVLTDYNMPGFSGLDLLREALLIRADLPVALASGYVTTEIEETAFEKLQSSIARAYHLDYDDAEKCTTANEGYFWQASLA